VQKAGLQPTAGTDPNHVAVDETVVQLSDEQDWPTILAIPTPTVCTIFAYIRRINRRFQQITRGIKVVSDIYLKI
jgi:hypothetical protein